MNGYESAFKGAMHAYGILANKAVRMVKHVTGLAGDSVEHYWPTECEQCKEIAAFLDEWQDRAAELPLERNTQHSSGGWISVEDALPENRVSRCVFNGRVRQMYYDPERKYWVDIRGEEHTDITHWMDLPDAPLS